MAGEFWLSDRQWAAIGPLPPTTQPGARRVDERRVISGIVHMLKDGGRWQDCPACYGPSTTIFNRYHRWSGRGLRPATSVGRTACFNRSPAARRAACADAPLGASHAAEFIAGKPRCVVVLHGTAHAHASQCDMLLLKKGACTGPKFGGPEDHATTEMAPLNDLCTDTLPTCTWMMVGDIAARTAARARDGDTSNGPIMLWLPLGCHPTAARLMIGTLDAVRSVAAA
jgi:transposase